MSNELAIGIIAAAAALAGAGIGAAGAVAAARHAALGARYQADKQAAAQHQQWLRQLLQKAYADFLAGATLNAGRIEEAFEKLDAGQNDRALDLITSADHASMATQLATLEVEAPDAVITAARTFTILIAGARQQVMEHLLAHQAGTPHDRETLRSERARFHDALLTTHMAFLNAARASLRADT
ncbi:hypothetical protein ACIQ7Q_24475 [Streptomyces sp. NPDC096176]|uniref:hypothetical protein n=1 Tax=Streptomyces sp. NPDC096176 TaxID=3366079 RepID=UPI0038006358